MSGFAIVWDKGSYAKRVASELGEGVCVIASEAELNEERRRIVEQDCSDSGLAVLLELSWKTRRSTLYGFEIVKELLSRDFPHPIVLTSFLSREKLYSVHGVGRWLSRMPFPFVRLPASPEAIADRVRKAEPFSPMCRAYVRENYLVAEPIGRIAHEMKNIVAKRDAEGEKDTEGDFNALKSTVRRLLGDLDAINADLPRDISEKKISIRKELNKEKSELSEAIKEFQSLLKEHAAVLASGSGKQDELSGPGYPIMLVEDDEVKRKEIRKGLEPYFNVFDTENAQEALDELRSSEHEYLAIVADWVLLEEDGITWQPLQGFDLLAKAWEESAPIALISLTSLHREAVTSVLRRTSLNVSWFTKSEVGESTRWPYHAFAGYIKKRVRSMRSDFLNIPNLIWWTEHGLGELLWRLKYESGDWSHVLNESKKIAQKVIDNFFISEVAKEPINKGEYRLYTPGRRNRNLKMKHIKKILPLRMSVIALHYVYNMSPLEIRFMLRMEDGDNVDDVENRMRQWYAKLGLKRDDGIIQKSSIFDHESEWLDENFDRQLGKNFSTNCGVKWLCEKVKDARNYIVRREGLEELIRNEIRGDIKTIGEAMETIDFIVAWVKYQEYPLRRWLQERLKGIRKDEFLESMWDKYDGHADTLDKMIESMAR